MKSGYVCPQTHPCMHPIDVPMMRRTWLTLRCSVSNRCCAVTMSSYVYFGNRAWRPSLGLLEPPCPMPSGSTMKYFALSSSLPGAKSSPA